MSYTASNHPILITGATQRLGLAIAEYFLAQAQPVIVTYRTKKPAVENLAKRGAILLHCDFEDEQATEQLVQAVKNSAPTLRGIIHNASDWNAETQDSADISLLNKMMRIHVNAPYFINWALQDNLKQYEGFADIVHMTDYVQDTGSSKHLAYSASKAALHNLTLSFAKKLAPNVKVNSVAPALVMFNEYDDEEYRMKAQKKSLLEAVPGATEAVRAIEYLFTSDYVTGQTLHLNGGRHLK